MLNIKISRRDILYPFGGPEGYLVSLRRAGGAEGAGGIIKSRTLVRDFLLLDSRRVSLAKKFFFSDRAQTFFGHVSANFPTFFFARFFFLLLFIILRLFYAQ